MSAPEKIEDLTGVIGVSRSKKIGSRIIRLITGSEWSHVFIVTDDNREGPISVLVLEARARGVFPRPFSQYADGKHTVELFRPRLSRENLKLSAVGMYRHIDKPYSKAALIGMGISIALGWLGIRIPNLFKWGQVCSETGLLYIWECIAHGLGDGDHLERAKKFLEMDRDTTSPENLYSEIVESGLFEIVPLPARLQMA